MTRDTRQAIRGGDKELPIEFLESTRPVKMHELSRVRKSRRDEPIAQAINLSCVSLEEMVVYRALYGDGNLWGVRQRCSSRRSSATGRR